MKEIRLYKQPHCEFLKQKRFFYHYIISTDVVYCLLHLNMYTNMQMQQNPFKYICFRAEPLKQSEYSFIGIKLDGIQTEIS